jgi:hypothetical protein
MEWGPILRAARTVAYWRAFIRTVFVGAILTAGAIGLAASGIGASQWLVEKRAPGAERAKLIEGIWNSIDWQMWGRVAPIIFALSTAAYAAFRISEAATAQAATIRIQVPGEAVFNYAAGGSTSMPGATGPPRYFSGFVGLKDIVVTNQSPTRQAIIKADLILLDERDGDYAVDPPDQAPLLQLLEESPDRTKYKPPPSECVVATNHRGLWSPQWIVRINRKRSEDWKQVCNVRVVIEVRDLLDPNGHPVRIPCPGEGVI